jgi:hypothetical protein
MLLARIEISNVGPTQRRNGINEVKGKKGRITKMVAEIEKSNIADTLAGRSEAELREIATRCQFLLGNVANTTDGDSATKPAKAGSKDDQEALQTAWDAFCQALQASEGSKPLPLSLTLRSRYGGQFRKVAKAIDRLIREDFRCKLPVERVKVARLLVGLAASEMEKQGLTVSIKTLCDRLKNPNAVIDRAFPGYRASGLLPMIVKRKNVK